MQANLHLKKEEEKAQAGNELSNILPKSSNERKKPPPPSSPCKSCKLRLIESWNVVEVQFIVYIRNGWVWSDFTSVLHRGGTDEYKKE